MTNDVSSSPPFCACVYSLLRDAAESFDVTHWYERERASTATFSRVSDQSDASKDFCIFGAAEQYEDNDWHWAEQALVSRFSD